MVEIEFYQIGNELPRLAFGVQRHWRFHPVTSVAPPRTAAINAPRASLAADGWRVSEFRKSSEYGRRSLAPASN